MRALGIPAALGVALGAGGCAQPTLPALQGWAVQNPVCVFLCWSVSEVTRDGAAGAVSFEPIGGQP